MIRRIEGMPETVVAIAAYGTVTRKDYDDVLVPAIENGLRVREKLRLFFQIAPDVNGLAATVAWDDAKIGRRYGSAFERIALVSDARWVKELIEVFGLIIPPYVRTFRAKGLADAKAWLEGR